jgi:hypothetical protein
MEDEKKSGITLWDGLLLLFGIGWLYRAWKGGIWAALWYPVGFVLMIACLVFFVGAILLAVIVKFWWVFLIIGLIALMVSILQTKSQTQPGQQIVEKKSAARPTDEQLTKIYVHAMDDLECGKISDRTFLKVAEKVRDYRESLSHTSP